MDTVRRSYEVKVARDCENTVAEIHRTYQRGAAAYLEFFTDLFGGFEPSFLPDSQLLHRETAFIMKRAKTELQVSPQAYAFTLWFHPVKNRPVETIGAAEVPARFWRYWGKKTYEDPAIVHLFHYLTSKQCEKRDIAWVDCRERFSRMGIDPQNTKQFYQDSRFPLHKEGEEMDAHYLRNLYCQMWPTALDRKTDYNVANRFLSDVMTKLMKNMVGWRWSTVAQELGVATVSEARERLGKKTGRFPGWISLLHDKDKESRVTEEEWTKFLGLVAQSRESTKSDGDFVRHQWMAKSLERFAHLPDHGEMRRQMISLAFQRYQPWRSNFLRQLALRMNYYKDFQEECGKTLPLPWICDILNSYKKKGVDEFGKDYEQDCITRRQIRGFRSVVERWGEIPKPTSTALCEAVDSLVKQRGANNFGDRGLFQAIAVKVNGDKLSDVQKTINLFLDRDSAEASYRNLFLPTLTWITDDNPQHPWFGDSKPYGDVDLPEGKVDGERYVTVLAADGKGKDKIRVYGKRMFRELYHGAGKEVSRDHSLVRKLHGLNKEDPVSPQMDKITVQPQRRGKEWFFKVSVQLPCPKRPSPKELVGRILNGEEVSILAVDRGFRNPLAFAHLKANVKGILLKKGDRSLNFKVVEMGVLSEQDRQSRDGRFFCRLVGGEKKKPGDEDVELLKRVRAESGIATWWLPRDQAEWGLQYANAMLSIIKRLAVKREQVLCLQRLGELEKRIFWRDVGALSLNRMLALRAFISACSAVEKIDKVRKEVLDVVIPLRIKAQNRLNNVRREAVRVSTNLIIRKAIEVGAGVIAIEDLDLLPEQERARRGNQKMQDWCCKRIEEEVQQQALLYGIFVKKVRPVGTSLKDFSTRDDVVKPKFARMTEFTDSFRKRLVAQLKGNVDSVRDMAVKAVWREFARQKGIALGERSTVTNIIRALEREVEKNGAVYVPFIWGEFYCCGDGRVVDSDFSAAAQIGKTALRSLMGMYDKREDVPSVNAERAALRANICTRYSLWGNDYPK